MATLTFSVDVPDELAKDIIADIESEHGMKIDDLVGNYIKDAYRAIYIRAASAAAIKQAQSEMSGLIVAEPKKAGMGA